MNIPSCTPAEIQRKCVAPKYEELSAVYAKQCVPRRFKHVVIHFQLLLWSQTWFLCFQVTLLPHFVKDSDIKHR